MKELKKKSNNNQQKGSKKWKKIKLKGQMMSEEGFALAGLVGLEVMECYDSSLVTKEKKKKVQQAKSKDGPRKRKQTENDSNEKNKQQKKTKNDGKDFIKPGRFVLVNKSSEPENIENSPLIDDVSISIDHLEGWNGLGVPDIILQALADKGYKSPTTIQALTLPAAIMGKKDILGAAETGSGKTLAFAIPVLSGILELENRNSTFGIRKSKPLQIAEPRKLKKGSELSSDDDDIVSDDDDLKDKPLYALVLTPTRELAVQVKDHIVTAAKYTNIKVAAIFGGLAQVKQERVLKSCPEIVVATPGRLWELLQQGNSHLNKIDNISFLVIDETDRMIEKGHFEELKMLLKRLNSEDGKKESRQNFLFSATLTLVHELPDYLQKKNIGKKVKLVKQTPGMKIQSLIEELGISQPKIVDVTSSRQTAESLTESRIICPIDQKDYYLYYFVQKHQGRTIVFCNSIDCVKRLAQLFGYLNCQPLPLHASMIQKQRLKNLERFRDNPNGFLIATDVAARGLDIPNIQHVIHYQVPRTSENYVHRSGRTARANKAGITIMFMEPAEMRNYLKLCKTLDRDEDLPIFPVSDRFMRGVKDRVNLAREVDKMELKLKRVTSEDGWFKKNAEEMEILLDYDLDNISDDENAMEKSKEKLYLTNKRKALASLLNKPLFPRGYNFRYPTCSGKLELPYDDNNNEDTNTAVTVMKESIEDLKELKKQRNKRKR